MAGRIGNVRPAIVPRDMSRGEIGTTALIFEFGPLAARPLG